MAKPLHTVAETSPYLADAAKAGLSAEEMQAIVAAIATDPEQGDLVQGSGGVRKVRIAGRGKGKSGGYRIMVAHVGDDAPAYILALLGKHERANFTDAQVNAMKAVTMSIKQYWRKRRKK
jgi:hypothetical protein